VLTIALPMLAGPPARAMWQPWAEPLGEAEESNSHLVVSELLTGATSASDEFIELFNPTAAALPLEGLEVVYVTASGATITRKATWPAGAASVEAGAHLLIANEAGVYAALADATYAGGLAATGGSVALRILGASSAIDALGWGNTVSTWLEGTAVTAPAAGSSLERLPGGVSGSFQDTDDNLVDFIVSQVPDPQNAASAPISGGGTPTPSPSATSSASATPIATPSPTSSATPVPTSSATPPATATPQPATPTPTPLPTPLPTPSPVPVLTIADARQLADGSTVTLVGVAISDATFTEGGGYLSDATGGIAVLMTDGDFSRGSRIQVSGVLDTRYEQRTVRAGADGVLSLGTALEPDPLHVATGSVGEPVEAILVEIEGEIVSGATTLSTGVAFDVDDGSGAIRVLVDSDTGVDTSIWDQGAMLTVVGVVGQRDATGTGASGYRIQPRDGADVHLTAPTPSPSPTASVAPTGTPLPSATVVPSATPQPSAGDVQLVSIAQARSASINSSVRIRGVVTLGNGAIDPTSAVIQDTSAAIVLRLGDDAGPLRRGDLVELIGKRSTKSGMLTIRVTDPIVRLGTQSEPAAVRTTTGTLGEDLEAQLVVARGALTEKPRRSSAGNVSFGIDDGSGEARVLVGSGTGIDLGELSVGSWIEVRGPLGQETTGSQPLRGYRIWPRDAGDIALLATPSAASSAHGGATTGGPGGNQAGRPNPTSVRLTALDRAQPADETAGSPRGRARSATTEPTLVGRGGAPAAAVSAPGALASMRPRSTRDPLGVLGVLSLALLALAALGYIGWRNGAIARLVALVRGSNQPEIESRVDADPLDDSGPGDATQPIPRLSVIRVPHEPWAP
jgi:uncharacterized protein YdeI (BOF family)